MLRFLDGCSHYSTAQILRKWSTSGLSNTTLAQVNGSGRNGVGALVFTVSVSAAGYLGWVQKTLNNQASWVIGFAVRFSALPPATIILIQLFDGATTQCDVRMTSGGVLSVTRNGTALTGGTAGVSLLANTWYYLEFQVTISNSIAANSCQVYKDGASIINVSAGQSTRNTANSQASAFQVGPVHTGGFTTYSASWVFCDFYVLDGQTGQTAPYGDTRVVTLFPTGTGTTNQFTPNTGVQSANWSRVNATVSGDGSSGYVQTGTVGFLDTYATGDLPAGTTTVRSAQVVQTAEETDVGTRTLGACLRSGGANWSSAGQQLTGGYAMYLYPYETDPNGSIAWTPTSINALEVGPVLVS